MENRWNNSRNLTRKDLPAGSEPENLTDVNGTLFFNDQFSQLWKSDGTAAGTVLVKDIINSPGGISISSITAVEQYCVLYSLYRCYRCRVVEE